MAWTESDIPDQSGRVALVTGANSGIGFEAARALAEHGAHVVLACRNRGRAEDAVARIGGDVAGSTEILDLDVGDLDSVAGAAAEFQARHDRLDLLINNAGVMATPLVRTPQGFEQQFGINHLGHFALDGLLLETVLATPGSRIVSIASQAHRIGRIDFDDPNSEKSYSPWPAYGQSKLANLLFIFELQRRLGMIDTDTIAVAAHPGSSATNLGHEAAPGLLARVTAIGRPLFDAVISQSAARGALPTLRAATDPSVRGGTYWGPSGPGESRGNPVLVDSNRRSKDAAVGARLWALSEKLTGVSYPGLD